LGKAIALLVIYGTALQLASAVYSSYRYNNVIKITVSKLSDLDEVFEVRHERLARLAMLGDEKPGQSLRRRG
jgi:hypothetical protein